MLIGKNVVIIKGEKNTLPQVIEYDRVYLENASSDSLEVYSKTSDDKDLELNGKKWEGTRPKEDTKADFEGLVQDALSYFTSKYPAAQGEDATRKAWLTFLERASYGEDLKIRNKIQADSRPSKPMDQAAAIDKAVKLVMALNPKLSRDAALVVAKSMAEASLTA